MLGLLLSVFSISKRRVAGGDDGWILGLGAWRDSGSWIDTDTWKDS